jgi:hypothetical protein
MTRGRPIASRKNAFFSRTAYPTLQISANLLLGESRKIRGLPAKKFGFAFFRGDTSELHFRRKPMTRRFRHYHR